MTVNKMAIILVIGGIIIAGSVWFYQKNSNSGSPQVVDKPYVVRYLPLGDSYTIGESVAEKDRWPNQLAEQYMPSGKRLEILDNPARTGYTAQSLIDKELHLVGELKPDFVTLQIGVNDYVQGVDAQTFDKNLRYIIEQIKPTTASILLVTIPDYAKTPAGGNFGDPAQATEAIKSFNQIIINVAAENKLPVADIFAASQGVTNDPELIAKDGLHPSAKQYASWVQIIKANLLESKIPN